MCIKKKIVLCAIRKRHLIATMLHRWRDKCFRILHYDTLLSTLVQRMQHNTCLENFFRRWLLAFTRNQNHQIREAKKRKEIGFQCNPLQQALNTSNAETVLHKLQLSFAFRSWKLSRKSSSRRGSCDFAAQTSPLTVEADRSTASQCKDGTLFSSAKQTDSEAPMKSSTVEDQFDHNFSHQHHEFMSSPKDNDNNDVVEKLIAESLNEKVKDKTESTDFTEKINANVSEIMRARVQNEVEAIDIKDQVNEGVKQRVKMKVDERVEAIDITDELNLKVQTILNEKLQCINLTTDMIEKAQAINYTVNNDEEICTKLSSNIFELKLSEDTFTDTSAKKIEGIMKGNESGITDQVVNRMRERIHSADIIYRVNRNVNAKVNDIDISKQIEARVNEMVNTIDITNAVNARVNEKVSQEADAVDISQRVNERVERRVLSIDIADKVKASVSERIVTQADAIDIVDRVNERVKMEVNRIDISHQATERRHEKVGTINMMTSSDAQNQNIHNSETIDCADMRLHKVDVDNEIKMSATNLVNREKFLEGELEQARYSHRVMMTQLQEIFPSIAFGTTPLATVIAEIQALVHTHTRTNNRIVETLSHALMEPNLLRFTGRDHSDALIDALINAVERFKAPAPKPDEDSRDHQQRKNTNVRTSEIVTATKCKTCSRSVSMSHDVGVGAFEVDDKIVVHKDSQTINGTSDHAQSDPKTFLCGTQTLPSVSKCSDSKLSRLHIFMRWRLSFLLCVRRRFTILFNQTWLRNVYRTRQFYFVVWKHTFRQKYIHRQNTVANYVLASGRKKCLSRHLRQWHVALVAKERETHRTHLKSLSSIAYYCVDLLDDNEKSFLRLTSTHMELQKKMQALQRRVQLKTEGSNFVRELRPVAIFLQNLQAA